MANVRLCMGSCWRDIDIEEKRLYSCLHKLFFFKDLISLASQRQLRWLFLSGPTPAGDLNETCSDGGAWQLNSNQFRSVVAKGYSIGQGSDIKERVSPSLFFHIQTVTFRTLRRLCVVVLIFLKRRVDTTSHTRTHTRQQLLNSSSAQQRCTQKLERRFRVQYTGTRQGGEVEKDVVFVSESFRVRTFNTDLLASTGGQKYKQV